MSGTVLARRCAWSPPAARRYPLLSTSVQDDAWCSEAAPQPHVRSAIRLVIHSGAVSTKEFSIALSLEDRIRVRFTLEANSVTEATVQLECEISDNWVPCRRYDSRHDFFHVHPAAWDDARDRRDPVPVASLSCGLTRAIEDLKVNWARYRTVCEAAQRGGGS